MANKNTLEINLDAEPFEIDLKEKREPNTDFVLVRNKEFGAIVGLFPCKSNLANYMDVIRQDKRGRVPFYFGRTDSEGIFKLVGLI